MKLNSYLRGLGIGVVVTALLMGVSVEPKAMTDEQIKAKARELGMVEKSEQVLSDVLPQAGSSRDNNLLAQNGADGQVTPGQGDSITASEENSVDSVFTDGIFGNTEKADNIPDEADKPVLNSEIKVGDKQDEAEDGQAPDNKNTEALSSEKKEKSTSVSGSKKEEKSTLMSDGEKKEKSTSVSGSKKEEKSSSVSGSKKEEKSSSVSDSKKEEKNPTESDGENNAEITAKENLVAGAAGTNSITVTSGMSSTDVAVALRNAGIIQDAAAFDKFLCENRYDRKISTGLKVIPQGASNVEIAGIITTR